MFENRLFANQSLSQFSGVGDVLEKKYNSIGIFSVKDLLLHFPLRYENRTIIKAISKITIGETITVQGQIIKTEVSFARKRMLLCSISDGTGVVTLRFMNFYPALRDNLQQGKWVNAYGEVKKGSLSCEIIHPQLKVRETLEQLNDDADKTYTPIYSTTYGLSQYVIRKNIQAALLLLKRNPQPEIFPQEIIKSFISIEEALNTIHEPPINADIVKLEECTHPAFQRLIFEELQAYHLSMQIIKKNNQNQQATPLKSTQHYTKPFLAALPFSPTKAQQRVTEDILADMNKAVPMMRLVQGDVGSGKTLVAVLAALCAIENNKQVVLMAPTEILAEQHYFNLKNWLEPLGITIDCLTNRLTPKAKLACYDNVQSGKTAILVGTHAVFYDKVQFVDLGLVVIDEQHRFGVNQRLTLWEKGVKGATCPHQLIMTATPIPRTLAMTVYADLDVSIIDELPPGRTPIQTTVITNSKRDQIIERIKLACLDGKQAYWVCTLVEESENLEAQAAEVLAEELKIALPEINIGLVHGRMKSKEKQEVMQSFKLGETQLLVATTVIEVGVDVPNASLLVIENAERLGLSQLHQLRGRVGRGSVASFCVLMYQPPLSKTAQARLKVMRESNDGFVIAQKDLEIRGSGEILGTKQVGLAEFRVVDLIRDQHLIPQVQKASSYWLENYPEQATSLIHCWLADREKYINA